MHELSTDAGKTNTGASQARLAAQLTLASEVEARGVGLHTGEDCSVLISPEERPTGIAFYAGGTRIQASAGNVTRSRRQTTLSNGSASVQTVEHLLAALAGMGIAHARIAVSGPEVPALDGSAVRWVQLIESAGTRSLGEPVPAPMLDRPLFLETSSGMVRVAPSDRYVITVSVEYRHVGRQSATVEVTPETFKREIAPARTFGFAEEARAVFAAGLASGASFENVLVIHDGEFSSPPRFPDELARHKMLDLIGDLALVGAPLSVHVEAVRPSHTLNVRLADMLAHALHVQRPA